MQTLADPLFISPPEVRCFTTASLDSGAMKENAFLLEAPLDISPSSILGDTLLLLFAFLYFYILMGYLGLVWRWMRLFGGTVCSTLKGAFV